MPTVELRFTPLPAHVRTARLLAAVLARRAGVDESLIDEVKLAVGEACARAVGIHDEHGGGDDVSVSLSDDDARFVVAVSDCGPPDADTALDATGEPVPDLRGLADSLSGDPAIGMPPGFGLAVIAGIVDDLEVTSSGPGTTVRMTWTADAAAGGAGG